MSHSLGSDYPDHPTKWTLKTLPIFIIFVTSWDYRAYDADIFAELADNGFSSCSPVVGVNSRKWDHLWEYLGATVFW